MGRRVDKTEFNKLRELKDTVRPWNLSYLTIIMWLIRRQLFKNNVV